MLKVSISLPAQTFGPDGDSNQPACEMLHPQFPTLMTASSSSSSSAFDMLINPSDDADSNVLRGVGEGTEDDLRNDNTVTSSECVELWVRIGAAGRLGSLS